MSAPTKKAPAKNKTKKAGQGFLNKPDNMLVEVLSPLEVGKIIAAANSLPSGSYDLVIEYKMGTAPLALEVGKQIPAIGVAFAGIGLRKSEKDNPLTIKIP